MGHAESLRRGLMRGVRTIGIPLTLLLLAQGPVRAETAVERAARTGVLSMAVPSEIPPYAWKDGQGALQGYAVDVAGLIAEEVSEYLGKPVSVVSVADADPQESFREVQRGDTDLFCGARFTWRREMFADFTVPFALSGLRLLTLEATIDGSPASIAGKRVGVIEGSLGAATLKALQPEARAVPLESLPEGIAALRSGRLDALIGDSLLMAGAARDAGLAEASLVPGEPYNRYAVACMLPQNNATLRNLASLAIAKMVQGYINDTPRYTTLVNRWLGPDSAVGLPPTVIKGFFQSVLLNTEQIAVPTSP